MLLRDHFNSLFVFVKCAGEEANQSFFTFDVIISSAFIPIQNDGRFGKTFSKYLKSSINICMCCMKYLLEQYFLFENVEL